MKFLKWLVVIAFLFHIVSRISSQTIDHSPLPPPNSPVMDYVGILDKVTKSRLERRLIEFRNQTNPSVEIAVVIVHTTGGRDIFEYSLAVARGWGIGSKEDDNPGLLLFIAFDDRKYFTHVSRDLEDELPDGVVGQIQRQYLVPAFRQGNYAKGIVDTIEAYIQKIQEKQSSTKVSEDKKSNPSQRDNFQVGRCEICFILIIILILFVLFGGIGKRKRRNNTGFFVFPVGSGSGWSSGGSDWDGGDWGGFGGGGDFGGGGAGGDW